MGERKKMKENQGGTESPFALVTQVYEIFMRHYSEANLRPITLPSQIPDRRGRKPRGKEEMKENQGGTEIPLKEFVKGKRKKAKLSEYVFCLVIYSSQIFRKLKGASRSQTVTHTSH